MSTRFLRSFCVFFSKFDDCRRYNSNTEGIYNSLQSCHTCQLDNLPFIEGWRWRCWTDRAEHVFFSGSQELVIWALNAVTWSSWIYFMVGPRLLFQKHLRALNPNQRLGFAGIIFSATSVLPWGHAFLCEDDCMVSWCWVEPSMCPPIFVCKKRSARVLY